MKQKEIAMFVGSFFVIVLIWIIFNIYHSANTSTIPDAVAVQVVPVDPNFDTETIKKLKNRKKVEPAFSVDTIVDESFITPTPPIEPTPSLSQVIPTTTIPEDISTESANLNILP